MEEGLSRAKVLVEGLPYIKKFYGKIVVIKYGGSAMIEDNLKDSFTMNVVLLNYIGMKPVIVHGGGPQINKVMERYGKEVSFFNGHRVTDRETMEIVEMVLCGKINKEIVANIDRQGGKAVGLSGVDANLIKAASLLTKRKDEKLIDLDHTGRVKSIDPTIISSLHREGFIPVIAPVGIDEFGKRYNINADLASGEIAACLKAYKLIFLTDIKGILKDSHHEETLISTIKLKEITSLIEKGYIKGGMIPKAEACKKAIKNGVEKVHIIDGRITHSLLLELFTDQGIGTQVIKE
ncbi:acetylglutamate kinase [bacterium]|nr:acetylglutamate kinase [bacterium]MBU0900162.1 acetylglutamate kinase [bacterium]MBU1153045.1 acetylglutamate kinase [bacterium]MBU2599119.1 acetylglutamate kinase [bacterium]